MTSLGGRIRRRALDAALAGADLRRFDEIVASATHRALSVEEVRAFRERVLETCALKDLRRFRGAAYEARPPALYLTDEQERTLWRLAAEFATDGLGRRVYDLLDAAKREGVIHRKP